MAILGGGGVTGWDFFTYFDRHERATVKGTHEFFNQTQAWMNEKRLGVDMGFWNQDARREDGYYFTQEQQNEMFQKSPCLL
jgi:hypothetical protein